MFLLCILFTYSACVRACEFIQLVINGNYAFCAVYRVINRSEWRRITGPNSPHRS